jgi:hypothetical protein
MVSPLKAPGTAVASGTRKHRLARKGASPLLKQIALFALAVAAFSSASLSAREAQAQTDPMLDCGPTGCGAGTAPGTSPPPPNLGYIVHLQGRGNATWAQADMAYNTSISATYSTSNYYTTGNSSVDWQLVGVSYLGGAFLDNLSGRQMITGTLRTYCARNDGRSCRIICHSAGCARTLYALYYDGLADQLPGLIDIEATASAAGGSQLASKSFFLTWEDIDRDLPPDQMRGTTYGPMQNVVRGWAPMFHIAGGSDYNVTKGNWAFPNSQGDGAVPDASSMGLTDVNAWGAFGTKYANRVYSEYEPYLDHGSMPLRGSEHLHRRLYGW